jgi:hypothetical protein
MRLPYPRLRPRNDGRVVGPSPPDGANKTSRLNESTQLGEDERHIGGENEGASPRCCDRWRCGRMRTAQRCGRLSGRSFRFRTCDVNVLWRCCCGPHALPDSILGIRSAPTGEAAGRTAIQLAVPCANKRIDLGPSQAGRGRFVFVGSRRPRLYEWRLLRDCVQLASLCSWYNGRGYTPLRPVFRFQVRTAPPSSPDWVISRWNSQGTSQQPRPDA